jgi:type 1 glutamine amidotransferase
LLGTIPGQPSEPVLWTNDTGKNKVIYTSLGHWTDWSNESFRGIMKNAVNVLLNLTPKNN